MRRVLSGFALDGVLLWLQIGALVAFSVGWALVVMHLLT